MGTTRNQYVKLERGIEKGGRRLSDIWIERAARAFEVDAGVIVSALEQDRFTVPVMGLIGAGAVIEPEFEQVPPEGLFDVELPFALPDEMIGLQVRGDSMLPRYDDGDVVVVYREQRKPVESYVGEEAAVRTTAGQRFLKIIQRGPSAGVFTLSSFNARPIEGARLAWIGEVYVTVRSGQLKRIERQHSNTVRRRALARGRETQGMEELQLSED
jgi:repressor LexA